MGVKRWCGTASLCFGLLTATLHSEARSYPIDCAILLCLAGGFPSSAECVAAKATMLQRIAPPVPRPPLQLWNCPMGGGGGAGAMPVALGADGLVPEVRNIRDGIELYWVRYRAARGSGDLHVFDQTMRGTYEEDGSFRWRSAKLDMAPDWLLSDLGIRRASLGHAETLIPIRAVGIGWRDHAGNFDSELARY